MKKNKVIVCGILLLFIQGTIFPQVRHKAQKHGFSMRMWINNFGTMGWITIPGPWPPSGPDSLGLEYPVGQQIEHLYGAGLWIGGLLNASRLVTVTYEGWAGPYYEMFPGSTPEDTLYALHNASRQDTIEPPGWTAYWGGALPFNPKSDHDIYYTYTDTAVAVSGHVPLRLKVIQSSFGWNEPAGEAITIIEYKLMNMGTSTIDSMYFGLFAETDVGPTSSPQWWMRNYSGYYPAIRTAYTHNPVDLGSTPVGFRLLGASQHFNRITFQWLPGPNIPPNDAGKYAMLSSGVIMPDEYPNLSDTRFVLSAGPYFIRPSTDPSPDTLIVTWAVVSGISLTSMYQNAVRADGLYREFLTSVEPPPYNNSRTVCSLPELSESVQPDNDNPFHCPNHTAYHSPAVRSPRQRSDKISRWGNESGRV
jgi:hypothetical protein